MLHVSCTLATKNIQDPSMLWFVGSIWTCLSHPTKAEYGGPRYRCERGVKRPSRESLGATLVSMAKRLAEQHFVVFLACVASVSVRFRRKERGTRVKDREKSGASKRAGRGWGRKEGNACRQTPGFWKPPTWSVTPEFANRHLMLSSTVIIDQ